MPSFQEIKMYNGHKRVHSLKFQSVALPNGRIGNLFGPMGKYIFIIGIYFQNLFYEEWGWGVIKLAYSFFEYYLFPLVYSCAYNIFLKYVIKLLDKFTCNLISNFKFTSCFRREKT